MCICYGYLLPSWKIFQWNWSITKNWFCCCCWFIVRYFKIVDFRSQWYHIQFRLINFTETPCTRCVSLSVSIFKISIFDSVITFNDRNKYLIPWMIILLRSAFLLCHYLEIVAHYSAFRNRIRKRKKNCVHTAQRFCIFMLIRWNIMNVQIGKVMCEFCEYVQTLMDY